VCFSDAKGKAVALDAVKASAVDTCEWSASRTRRKGPPVPIGQEAGWAPEPVWSQRLEEKYLCHCRGSNVDCPVVQSVARLYTDRATPAACFSCGRMEYWCDALFSFVSGKYVVAIVWRSAQHVRTAVFI
jgi:hypothetical protein